MSEQNKAPKTQDFRLSLVDDKTHRQLYTLRFTRSNFIVLVISAIVVVCGGLFCIIAFTPIKTFIPGYPNANTKRAAVQNAIRVDSLERVISRWEYYSDNLLTVLEGGSTVSVDSIFRVADMVGSANYDKEYLNGRDSVLRDVVNKAEQFEVGPREERSLPIEGLHFFTPLKGTVVKPYDAILHPYLDVAAPANSVVMAALGGTVVLDMWSEGSGYIIAIQHDNDIVTIYKQNLRLLRKTGDTVSAGTPIGVVGDSGEGEHLHFELWYRGQAVDPSKYLNFK